MREDGHEHRGCELHGGEMGHCKTAAEGLRSGLHLSPLGSPSCLSLYIEEVFGSIIRGGSKVTRLK